MPDGPDDRPQQFKAREAELHEVRKRMHADNLNWAVDVTRDFRDLRDPQLLGESLLRMRRSGRLSLRHDKLEAARAIG
jgi:hypothetical protein